MASRTQSVHSGVDRQEDRSRSKTRSDLRGAEDQALIPSGFCPVCFLIFGDHERRVVWGEEAVHPWCASRLRISREAKRVQRGRRLSG